MKNLFLLLILLALACCSVQKRHYTSGYYVRWNKETQNHLQPAQTNLGKTQRDHRNTDILTSSSDQPVRSSPVFRDLIISKSELPDSCDILLMKDGEEIKVKILEVNASNIRYKKCSMLNGPLYTTSNADVFMITYSNGTKEVIKEATSSPTVYSSSYTSSQKKQGSRSKDATTAFVLSLIALNPFCFFLGIIASLIATNHLHHIKKDSEKYTGKSRAKFVQWFGLATAAISLFFLILIINDASI